MNATSRQSWGRPVDVQRAGADGTFLVTDDKSNSIYRFVGAPRAP